MSTSWLFKRFYYLKSQNEFYFFQSKGTLIVTKLSKSNKGWKRHFVRIMSLTGFKVNLKWRVVNVDWNREHGVSSNEWENYEKILGQEFTRELVEDNQELRRHWPAVVLPNVDPQS